MKDIDLPLLRWWGRACFAPPSVNLFPRRTQYNILTTFLGSTGYGAIHSRVASATIRRIRQSCWGPLACNPPEYRYSRSTLLQSDQIRHLYRSSRFSHGGRFDLRQEWVDLVNRIFEICFALFARLVFVIHTSLVCFERKGWSPRVNQSTNEVHNPPHDGLT